MQFNDSQIRNNPKKVAEQHVPSYQESDNIPASHQQRHALKDQNPAPMQQDLQCKEETKLVQARTIAAPQNPNI